MRILWSRGSFKKESPYPMTCQSLILSRHHPHHNAGSISALISLVWLEWMLYPHQHL